jgi:hypothetical protein
MQARSDPWAKDRASDGDADVLRAADHEDATRLFFTRGGAMRTLVAIVMGAFSGFLVYMMAAMLFSDPGAGGPSPVLVLVTFIGGSAVSGYLLARNASTVSAVFRRGFLLGAAEWLAMAAVGLIFASRTTGSAISSTGGSEANAAGAAIGRGLVAVLAGGVSVFMSVVCLIGFAIAYFMSREMKNTAGTPTRKCPECAEMIQAEAKKCRHCGATLSLEKAAGTTAA